MNEAVRGAFSLSLLLVAVERSAAQPPHISEYLYWVGGKNSKITVDNN
jgi:hypothetical protein